jgi:hypothetical protein
MCRAAGSAGGRGDVAVTIAAGIVLRLALALAAAVSYRPEQRWFVLLRLPVFGEMFEAFDLLEAETPCASTLRCPWRERMRACRQAVLKAIQENRMTLANRGPEGTCRGVVPRGADENGGTGWGRVALSRPRQRSPPSTDRGCWRAAYRDRGATRVQLCSRYTC